MMAALGSFAWQRTAAQTPPRPPEAVWGQGSQGFSLATGSPGELGLLEALATRFAARHDATVRWYKAGSGQAMALLKARQVDMVLAHAPLAEHQAVAEGWATGRVLIGANEFWILGPLDDPARLSEARDAVDAFRRLLDSGVRVVSRGDNSGTHQKEQQIWQAVGREPAAPALIVTRAFMTACMQRANDEGAYFLTDSSTFIAERQRVPRLRRVFRGGELLANPYHTLYLSEPTPGASSARRFGEWLLSDEAQGLLRAFGRDRYGEPMYVDAAEAARLLRP
ncbi:MAG: substrate-binding domain-containing protein [Burkholderiales bacterium]|nr:substrate-binding domain-containing protein [Burkholderiales bacterium]